MINSINSGMSMPAVPTRQDQKLSAEQQTLISDTLAELDSENLTEEDALSIQSIFSEAGIKPSRSLETAMSDMGFDTKTVGDLAAGGQGGMAPPPPPPPQSSDEISSMVSYLEELLEEQILASETNEISDQERQAIYAQVMEKFGIEEGDSIIDTIA